MWFESKTLTYVKDVRCKRTLNMYNTTILHICKTYAVIRHIIIQMDDVYIIDMVVSEFNEDGDFTTGLCE